MHLEIILSLSKLKQLIRIIAGLETQEEPHQFEGESSELMTLHEMSPDDRSVAKEEDKLTHMADNAVIESDSSSIRDDILPDNDEVINRSTDMADTLSGKGEVLDDTLAKDTLIEESTLVELRERAVAPLSEESDIEVEPQEFKRQVVFSPEVSTNSCFSNYVK